MLCDQTATGLDSLRRVFTSDTHCLCIATCSFVIMEFVLGWQVQESSWMLCVQEWCEVAPGR